MYNLFVFSPAVLKVANEDVHMLAPGSYGGLDLTNGSIYYGGLPTYFRKEKFKDL